MSAAGADDTARGAPLLRVSIRRKVYRRAGLEPVEAVRDLDFAIYPDEITCLIGPSGAGKSTTLRVLLGLDRAFEGRVEPEPGDAGTAVVFQEPRLLPWRTVEQNVRLGLPRAKRGRDLDALFAALDLEAWRARHPGALSLGMQRRVALARALALEPRLIVLDEPFVSLDDAAANALRGVVVSAAEQARTSILMVTHNIDEALAIADRLLLLTPRPATLAGSVRLDAPRGSRDRDWIAARRHVLARDYPAVIAA